MEIRKEILKKRALRKAKKDVIEYVLLTDGGVFTNIFDKDKQCELAIELLRACHLSKEKLEEIVRKVRK